MYHESRHATDVVNQLHTSTSCARSLKISLRQVMEREDEYRSLYYNGPQRSEKRALQPVSPMAQESIKEGAVQTGAIVI